MKRVLIFLLAATFAGQVSAANFDFSAKSSSGQTLYYKITSDSTVTITYPNSDFWNFYDNYDNYTKPTGALEIPDKVSNNNVEYAVTSIGDIAFFGCGGLTSVTIGNSVTTIGHSAFFECNGLTSVTIGNSVTNLGVEIFEYCFNLTSVIIPESLTKIGDYMFLGCSSLTSVIIPESVTSIGDGAFLYCSSLTSVIIPESVTSIGGGAFNNCDNLTSIIIPNSVTDIGDNVFRGCHSLTSIIIPNSVTNIGDDVFIGCSKLTEINVESDNTKYTSIDGVLFNKDKTTIICCPQGKAGTYTIPNSVTSIDEEAFEGCSGLTAVTIPESVINIGSWAFSGCSGLTSVTIPNSVTAIGGDVFDCSKLTEINVESDNTKYTSIDGVLFSKDKKTLISYPPGKIGEYIIPHTADNIAAHAFSSCSDLTTITIPNTVKTIDAGAFTGGEATIKIMVNEIPDGWDLECFYDGRYDGVILWAAINESSAIANNIYAHDRTIVVENATDEISVYDAMGRLVGKDNAHIVSTITVNNTGVYIVKTGDMVKRVFVK